MPLFRARPRSTPTSSPASPTVAAAPGGTDARVPSAAAAAAATTSARAWAQRMVANPHVVYLDTETTGLDSSAEIIEIALVDGSGRVLLDSLVRPQRAIPTDATRIHGITNADVAGAPLWGDLWPQVSALLAAHTVVVYNASFDYRMVCQMNRAAALAAPPDDWQCAMLQYSNFAAVWHARFGNFRWHRLDDAAARFVAPGAAPSHRALADAVACRAVVLGMANTSPSTTLR
jgi:DNA polymerase-3 subunit epsilon